MRRFIYYLLAVCFLFCCITDTIVAQKKKLGVLSGQIYNAKTRKVIEGVNVYIPQLNIGTSSNKYGHYRLKKIPPGTYDFVYSCVGYKTKTTRFNITNKHEYEYKAYLEPTEIDLEKVEIVAQSPTEWRRLYKIFENQFLGQSKFSKLCKIKNKEKIDLFVDKKTNKLIAICDTLIQVDNFALGYFLDVQLKKFEFDFTDEYAVYDFYVLFKSMQSNNLKEIIKWQSNRIDAFKGTLQHFFSDLASGNFNKFEFVLTEGRFKDYVDERSNLEDKILINRNQLLTVPGVKQDLREKTDITYSDLNIKEYDKGKFILPVENCFQLTTCYSSKSDVIYIESKTKKLIFNSWGHILNPQDLILKGNDLIVKIPEMLPQDYLSR